MSQGGLSSPIAWVYKWWGRPPTESEERLESRYRRTPDQEPLQAGGVRGEVDRTSAEDSEALAQQVEGPNGLPRGGATSWAPQEAVTSTPAGREALNYMTGQDLLTPVAGRAGAHGNGTLNPAAGLMQTPDSLREEEEGQARLRDPCSKWQRERFTIYRRFTVLLEEKIAETSICRTGILERGEVFRR
eukprot:GHVR01091289.1.p1 GENE.GHVR01091289.1~~GHVR01091289.1.p1  ORF type:complete len:188 (+),score=20.54 GHVR01091289.1:430-993(+)